MQGSTYTSTPLSIQCRRLPEPPPYPGQQLQQPAHGNNQYTHSYEVPKPIGNQLILKFDVFNIGLPIKNKT